MDQQTITEVRQTALQRTRIYRWLSHCFARELDEEALHEFTKAEGQLFLEALAENLALKPGIDALRTYFSENGDLPEMVVPLSSAFSFLFLGAGGKKSAPPYESVFISEHGSMYQEPHSQMLQILQEQDLSIPEGFHEPADHIAVQLDLMAQLSERMLQEDKPNGSVKIALDGQQQFLDQHLLNWVPNFCQRCIEHDPSTFYRGLSQVLLAFIQEDRTYVEDVLKDLS